MWYSFWVKTLSTKWFKKWSSKVNLKDEDLIKTIQNLGEGLSTANLGGNLFKVRVKRECGGKSSGFRTLVAYKVGDKAIFLYGFGKNERGNIDSSELKYFKKLGVDLLHLSDIQLQQSLDEKILFEIEVSE